MITEAQLAANRANAQKSTGPKTEERKANSSRNSFKHGLYRRYEASLLESGEILIPHLTAIQRIMSSAERGFHKALTALRRLQKGRRFVPQKQESGFVPTSPPVPEPRPGVPERARFSAQGSGATGFVPPPCAETGNELRNKQESPSSNRIVAHA
jgi:hypothetical protein